MEEGQFTDRQVIQRKPIHVGEHVPRWIMVRHRDELLRVVNDDYVRWNSLGASEEARKHLDALLQQREEVTTLLRKIDAQIAHWQSRPEIAAPFTGMSDTLQAIAFNASGEPMKVRVLRREVSVVAEDQDIPALRDWVERKETGK